MMLFNHFKARRFTALFVVALFVPLLTPTAANAQVGPITCTPSTTQSGAVVTCSGNGGSVGGGGGTGAHQADHSWTVIAEYPNEPCIDQFGNASYYVDIVQQGTGSVLLHHCTTVNTNGTAPTVPTNEVLQAQASTLVVSPTATADYKGNFLTGAQVQFSSGGLGAAALTQPVPGVAGAYLQATPSNVTWDFGDSKAPEPCAAGAPDGATCHTYLSTTPDPAKPDNHTVSVKVTGTWDLRFHQPAPDGTDAVINLAPITLSGTLNPNPRTIVQVWSAQTEPK